MKKELKHKIKQDEFVSFVQRAIAWVPAHRDEARLTTIVVVVLAAAGGALAYFQSHRAQEAERALSEALETFGAPVQAELPEGAEKPAGPVFASASEKYNKAAAAFDGVERKYASQPAGRRARYYGALCRLELGQTQEAEKALAELAAQRDEKALEPALARLALADLYRRSGQAEKAIEAYRRLSEDASLPLPRDHALMGLARTLEEARRFAEARESYRRIGDEFPSSVYAAEARRRASFLETAQLG